MPDVDMTSTYTDVDGEEKEFTVPMTVTFLCLTPEYKPKIHEQLFQISFNSQGMFSFTEVYNMPYIFVHSTLRDYKNILRMKLRRLRKLNRSNKSSIPSYKNDYSDIYY